MDPATGGAARKMSKSSYKTFGRAQFYRKKRYMDELGPEWKDEIETEDKARASAAGDDSGKLDKLIGLKESMAKNKDAPHMQNWCGVKFYNSFFYRIPYYNLVHPFLDPYNDHMLWSQLDVFLNNIGVVLALQLSLVVAFYAATSYMDMVGSDVRYGVGAGPGSFLETPWDHLTGNADMAVVCAHGSAMVNGTACTIGQDLTGKCPYPCFEDRTIDADGTMVTGGYAKWWHQNEASGKGGLLPSTYFNAACMNSLGFLTSGLLASVLGLALAPANDFLREDNVHSQTNAVVMGSYTFWMKIFVLLIIMCWICGSLFFVETIRLMVFLKFTDKYIEDHWDSPKIDATFDSQSPYMYIKDGVNYTIYGPMVITCLFCSLAQYAAYCFPLRPYGTYLELTTKHGYFGSLFRTCFPFCFAKDEAPQRQNSNVVYKAKDGQAEPVEPETSYTAYRLKQTHLLTEFLVKEVKLPHTWQAYGSGPRDLAYDVFLSVAGGQPAMEAEIVANALIDNHIDSKYILWEMVKHAKNDGEEGDEGQLPQALHDVFAANTAIQTLKEKIELSKEAQNDKAHKRFTEELEDQKKLAGHQKVVSPATAHKLCEYYENEMHLPIRSWEEFGELFMPIDDYLGHSKKYQIPPNELATIMAKFTVTEEFDDLLPWIGEIPGISKGACAQICRYFAVDDLDELKASWVTE